MRGTLFLIVFSFLSSSAFAQDDFNSISRGAANSAGNTLDNANAEDSLGVTASGGMSSGGRDVDVEYAQVLEGSFQCPLDGEAGRRTGIQQFTVQCEPQGGAIRQTWVCVPNDPNDTMGRECDDGQWFNKSVTVGNASWTDVTTGVQIRIPACEGDDCQLNLKRSGSFEGGEGAADSEGQQTLANASGTSDTIKRQGAYLPDGTALQTGSNPNSGQIAGEMMAAGSAASCADDIKASLDEGTPVFTCDGSKEVDHPTAGQGECEDYETCTQTETETVTSTKSCTVSILYEGAECNVQTPTQVCDIVNIYESQTCDKAIESEVKVTKRYSAPEPPPCTNSVPGFTQAAGSEAGPTKTMVDKIHNKIMQVGGYPATVKWSGGSITGVPSKSTLQNAMLYGAARICQMGYYEVTCKRVTINNCSYVDREVDCASGYTKSGSYCVQNTNVSGFSYLTAKADSSSSRPGAQWLFYEKESLSNGCATYE